LVFPYFWIYPAEERLVISCSRDLFLKSTECLLFFSVQQRHVHAKDAH
jgi:hypothetical protein